VGIMTKQSTTMGEEGEENLVEQSFPSPSHTCTGKASDWGWKSDIIS